MKIHFVPPEERDEGWHTVCGRDVQDFFEDETYTLHAWEANCEDCKRGLVFLP